MITQTNKNFLAKFGDNETREHLAATNGPHEIHLYSGTQEPTEKMIRHSLNSPNYNAQMCAINSGKLSQEQAETHLHKYPSSILEKYPLKPNVLHNFAMTPKAAGHDAHIVHNALESKRTDSEKIDAVHKIMDASSHRPNIIQHLAYKIDEVPKENHAKLADHILNSNPAIKPNAAAKFVAGDVANHHVEKLLSAMPEHEYPTLHQVAAKHAKLTDERIQKNLEIPHLANKMSSNMKLSDEQSKKIPNHIFTELGMF